MLCDLPIVRDNLDGTFTLHTPLALPSRTVVPEGFNTDGASVPWLLRRFWPRIGARYSAAAIGHDYAYQQHAVSRRRADREFLYNMEAYAVPRLTRYAFYIGVRLCGRGRWKKSPGIKSKMNSHRP